MKKLKGYSKDLEKEIAELIKQSDEIRDELDLLEGKYYKVNQLIMEKRKQLDVRKYQQTEFNFGEQ